MNIVNPYRFGGGGSLWGDVSNTTAVADFLISGTHLNPLGLWFKDDGTKMYTGGGGAGDIYQWSLSTAWDITTASYDSVSYASGGNFSAAGFCFANGGTKFYMANYQNERIYGATLSTAWDLSTASSDSFITITETTTDGVRDVMVSSDGFKIFIAWNSNDTIREYPLSTAFDLSTIGSETTSFDISAQIGTSNLRGMSWEDNGFRFFALQQGTGVIASVFSYTCSTAWDLTTASYDSLSYVNSQDSGFAAIYVRQSGDRYYLAGITNDKIYAFDF